MESFNEFYKRNHKRGTRTAPFGDYLFRLMKNKHVVGASLYVKANINHQAYTKIIANKMEPSLNMIVKLAIALHCSYSEYKTMLKKVGYSLSNSSKFALVIQYCLENKIYDFYRINDLLIDHQCAPLDKVD